MSDVCAHVKFHDQPNLKSFGPYGDDCQCCAQPFCYTCEYTEVSADWEFCKLCQPIILRELSKYIPRDIVDYIINDYVFDYEF